MEELRSEEFGFFRKDRHRKGFARLDGQSQIVQIEQVRKFGSVRVRRMVPEEIPVSEIHEGKNSNDVRSRFLENFEGSEKRFSRIRKVVNEHGRNIRTQDSFDDIGQSVFLPAFPDDEGVGSLSFRCAYR